MSITYKFILSHTTSTERVAKFFKKDPKDLSDDDIKEYGNLIRDQWAGSNDGSEMLANCPFTTHIQ